MEGWATGLSIILAIIIFLLLTFLLMKIYLVLTKGYYEITNDLTGKTVLITGANTGIGKETALALAAKGAKVIIACRNQSKGENAKKEIIEKTGNQNVVLKQLDLCSFKSVRALAEDILQMETRLDILINNAGMNNPPDFKRTDDGFDETLQANHLGHFLLTLLLLDLLKRSAPSTIVIVASMASWLGISDPRNLNMRPTWIPFINYGKTKTFNILFGVELAEKLKGTGVTAHSCHPGVVQTEFLRPHGNKRYHGMNITTKTFGKTAKEGAMTTLYLATSDDITSKTSGAYFSDCRRGFAPPWATSKTRAKRLWETSLKAVGLEKIQETDSENKPTITFRTTK